MKRIVTILVFLLVPVAVFAADFSDVQKTNPYVTAIQNLRDAGVISGYPDGTFRPDATVNRAEALAIMLKAAGISFEKTSAKMPFKDVSEGAWYYGAVQKGLSLGKIKGYTDGTFRPEATVTLPETLAMMTSFFGVSIKGIAIDSVIYGGVDTTQWYAPYVQYAKDHNLIEPDQKGYLSMQLPVSRGSFAEVTYRMRAVNKTGQAFDVTTNWVTESYPENYWQIKHPAEWNLALKGTSNSVLVRGGARVPHFFTRVFNDGARLSLSVVENPDSLSVESYFAQLKTDYASGYDGQTVSAVRGSLSGKEALWIKIPQSHAIDAAIYLPSKKILMIYGDYGAAPIGEYYKKQIETMIGSYQYLEKPAAPTLSLDEREARLRENILVKDMWKVVAPLFPDKKLISTDAIGIGTGPVDYYYTAEANMTIKLDRNSGTILNTHEGSTTAF